MFLILPLKILYSFSFGLWIEVNVLVNLKSLFIISPYFIFSELGSQRKKISVNFNNKQGNNKKT